MREDMKRPPRILRYLFHFLTFDSVKNQSYLGDCEELYSLLLGRKGRFHATLWYFIQPFKSFPSIFWKQLIWTGQITLHYTRFTLRYVHQHVSLSAIKLISLSIGLLCAMLFYFTWQFEIGFDQFHKQLDQIVRVDTETEEGVKAEIPFPMADLMRIHDTMIQKVSRLYKLNQPILRYKNHIFEADISAAEKDLFDIFTLEIISGDFEAIFHGSNTILLSQSKSLEIFQNQNPLGHEIELFLSHKAETEIKTMVIGGIFKDLPNQSTLIMDGLLPWSTMEQFIPQNQSWNYSVQTYALISNNASVSMLEKDLNQQFMKEKPEKIFGRLARSKALHLTPFASIHRNLPGLKTYLSIFAAITFFVVILSCINYINLTTNQALERTKEIGIKKVNGAERSHLASQFLLESILTSVSAFFLSIMVFPAMLPFLNGLLGKTITLADLATTESLFQIFLIILIIGVVSGGYPAFYLSSIKPKDLFRQCKISSTSRSKMKRILVTFQFLMLTILLTSALVARKQLMFVNNADLGLDPENVIIIETFNELICTSESGHRPLKDDLLSYRDIVSLSSSWQLPTKLNPVLPVDKPGALDNQRIHFASLVASKGLLDTYGIVLQSGRCFEEDTQTKPSRILINETAASRLGLTDPIGKKIITWGGCHAQFRMDCLIIGIIKDYHTKSLHHPIPPLMIEQGGDNGFYLAVRVHPGCMGQVVADIRKSWEKLYPNLPLKYKMLKDVLRKEYQSENHLVKLSETFTGLSVLISLLGLIGLITFHTDRRKKEIGIRKVLGAKSGSLYWHLIREFIKPVLLANAIGLPAAWWIVRHWLQQFAYQTSIPVSLYIVAGMMTTLIAVVTVSLQILKAIGTDPTHYLQYE